MRRQSAPAKAMTARKEQLAWVASLLLGVLTLDQAAKAIVRVGLALGTVARDGVFFQFVHYRNEGLVGGTFSSFRVVAFIAPPIALAILVYLFRHLEPRSKWQAAAYGSIVGGALGNIADRLLFGGVTDFLQFHFYFIPINFPWKFFPAFNVADAAIDIGVVVLIVTWNLGVRKNVSDTV